MPVIGLVVAVAVAGLDVGVVVPGRTVAVAGRDVAVPMAVLVDRGGLAAAVGVWFGSEGRAVAPGVTVA